MTKEQQDLAWRCLPKEAREEIKNYQLYNIFSGHTKELIDIVFGYHNLTSDEEPSELLFVERKRVQQLFSSLQSR